MSRDNVWPRLTRNPAWVFAGLALALFALYAPTVPPGVVWGDSGELATACTILGVPHPTGYPLYTMVGFVWVRLLFMLDPAHALNWLSTLCAAAGVGVMAAAANRLLTFLALGRPQDRLLGSAVGALLVGLAPTYWSQAVVCEVYAPLALLAALALLFWLRALEGNRWFWTVFLLTTAVLHHRLALMLIPGLLLLSPRKLPTDLQRATLGDTWRTLGAALLALTPILYLPLRAAMQPALNNGDPSSLGRLWAHLMGEQYSGLFQPIPALVVINLPLRLLPEFHITLLLALVGVMAIAYRCGWAAGGVVMLWLTPHAFAESYRVGDQDVFFFLGYMMLALMLAAGTTIVLDGCRRGGSFRSWRIAALALTLLPVLSHSITFPQQYHARRALALEYAEALLTAAPPNAVILTGLWYPHADNEYFSLLYARHARNIRPDVDLLGANFLIHDWYARQKQALGIEWHAPDGIMTAEDYFTQLYAEVIAPLMQRRPVCVTHGFHELHERPMGHRDRAPMPIRVPPALRALRHDLLVEATPNLEPVAPHYRAYIPTGRLFQLRERKP